MEKWILFSILIAASLNIHLHVPHNGFKFKHIDVFKLERSTDWKYHLAVYSVDCGFFVRG